MESSILEVKNFETLQALKIHEKDEIAFCVDENKYFKFIEDTWVEIDNPNITKTDNSKISISLFDLNKKWIKDEPILTEEELNSWEKAISNQCTDNAYLLYGREIGYFTLFELNKEKSIFKTLGEAVIACVQMVTPNIRFIEQQDNNVFEIWIDYNDSVTVLYLFNYVEGIVAYGS